MNRRGFLGSILLAAAAPAIVRADSLMRIIPRDLVIATPHPWEIPYNQVFAGMFDVSDTVRVAEGVVMVGCQFIFPSGFRGPLVQLPSPSEDAAGCHLQSNHFATADPVNAQRAFVWQIDKA